MKVSKKLLVRAFVGIGMLLIAGSAVHRHRDLTAEHIDPTIQLSGFGPDSTLHAMTMNESADRVLLLERHADRDHGGWKTVGSFPLTPAPTWARATQYTRFSPSRGHCFPYGNGIPDRVINIKTVDVTKIKFTNETWVVGTRLHPLLTDRFYIFAAGDGLAAFDLATGQLQHHYRSEPGCRLESAWIFDQTRIAALYHNLVSGECTVLLLDLADPDKTTSHQVPAQAEILDVHEGRIWVRIQDVHHPRYPDHIEIRSLTPGENGKLIEQISPVTQSLKHMDLVGAGHLKGMHGFLVVTQHYRSGRLIHPSKWMPEFIREYLNPKQQDLVTWFRLSDGALVSQSLELTHSNITISPDGKFKLVTHGFPPFASQLLYQQSMDLRLATRVTFLLGLGCLLIAFLNSVPVFWIRDSITDKLCQLVVRSATGIKR